MLNENKNPQNADMLCHLMCAGACKVCDLACLKEQLESGLAQTVSLVV